jgi:hypothetical protein
MKKILICLLLVVSSASFAKITPEDCFTFNETTQTILSYNCSDSSVVIPGSINKIGVKVLGVGSFNNVTNLKSVSIPYGVVQIEDRAFENNSLTSVSIPASVNLIGWSAFAGNELTSVNIPSSVTHIDFEVFAGLQT